LRCSLRIREVFDDAVRSWEEQALTPGVVPTNQIRRAAVFAFDGEDQRVTSVLTDVVATHDDAVPNGGAHLRPVGHPGRAQRLTG